MAHVTRPALHSSRFSSPLFYSPSPSLVSSHAGLIPSTELKKPTCSASASSCPRPAFRSPPRLVSFKVNATVAETEQPKWWEKNAGPNMIDIHSTQDFLNELGQAGESLVVVEFYGTWCASCRALFPKLCRTAMDHPEILFLKVNFDENKPMCKNLNVRVLPYFHFYRGADGQLEAFSCSLAKFQKIKDAIEMHNTARCSIGPPRGLGDLLGSSVANDKQAGSSHSPSPSPSS